MSTNNRLGKVGIYKITNLVNGRIYIGKSVDIDRRWKEHIIESSNPLLRADFELQGSDCFKFEILEICKETELKNKEAQYILQYKKKGNLYNSITPSSSEYALYRRVEYKGEIYKNYNNLARKLQTTSRKAYDLIRKGEAKFID